ncbi:28S ribosomal protein S5, mitochondrial [Quaeritorhiza haematococci]|nr:28S ribosomal protein S5, mitochondrial [Quaeritorhiza haematococci]
MNVTRLLRTSSSLARSLCPAGSISCLRQQAQHQVQHWTPITSVVAPSLARSFASPSYGQDSSSSSRPQQSSSSSSSSRQASRVTERDYIKRLLLVRRVARATGGGKKRHISALVVVGDGNGRAGFGQGRAVDGASAVQKATTNAIKNMVSVQRFDNRTIFSDVDIEFHGVKLQMWAAPAGYGIVANDNIHEICRCFGIADIAAKVRGSRNPLNVVQATFKALTEQLSPAEIARMRGKHIAEVSTTYYGVADTEKV